ncbi:hypothetical protein F7734_34785 [Scytonema sp. UIC 10036]|nr:hypothetical protein [Scytonema sp. UIC 10036]
MQKHTLELLIVREELLRDNIRHTLHRSSLRLYCYAFLGGISEADLQQGEAL